MFGGIDHARCGVFVLNEERALENQLATQATPVAAPALIRFPAVKNIVREKACKKPSASSGVGMFSIEKAADLAKSNARLGPINPPV